ncbi:MAG TPA: DUF4190 domain-containing protein [Ktedonobacterales bacterium]
MSNPYPPDPYGSSSSYDPYRQPENSYPQYNRPENSYGQYSPPPLYAPPAQPVYIQPVIVGQQTNGKATAAMILGLLVFVAWFLTGIPAVILGHMALGEINASGGMQGGRGMAITGLVLGYISIAGLGCICLLFLLGALSPGASPRY